MRARETLTEPPAEETRPLAGRHACVMTPASRYSRFRSGARDHDGKKYTVIYGKVKGEPTWEQHSFHYPTETWTESAARSHCKSHDGSFEPAAAKKSEDPVPEPAPRPAASPSALILAQRAACAQAVGRMVRREIGRARDALKTPDKVAAWVARFYGHFGDVFAAALLPIAQTHVALVGSDADPHALAKEWTTAHVAESRAALLTLTTLVATAGLDVKAYRREFDSLIERWSIERPGALADRLMQEELAHADAR